MSPQKKVNISDKSNYSVNCSLLLTEYDVLKRPEMARRAGFSQVEFWWPFDGTPVPSSQAVNRFIESLNEAGVTLAALNFWSGSMAAGDRGVLSVPGHSPHLAENAGVVAYIGESTGCRSFNALYGLTENGLDPAAGHEVALENLEQVAQAVEHIDGIVMIEPLSGVDAYPLKTARDALGVLNRAQSAGINNVKLLADFYHLAVLGDDLEALIDAHAHDFGHIQIADNPGRGAPGTGNLPLTAWVERAYNAGYQGLVGLEYKQAADTAFMWLNQLSKKSNTSVFKNT